MEKDGGKRLTSGSQFRLLLLALAIVAACAVVAAIGDGVFDECILVDSETSFDPGDSGWARKSRIESARRMQQLRGTPNTLDNWPPELGKPFPQVDLFDHRGETFSVDSFLGKPTLIEIVAMTCAGCQAFSGANEVGPYARLASQENLQSIEHYFRTYSGGHELYSDRLHFAQLIIYNDQLKPPTAEDLNRWRTHFKLDSKENSFVISGGSALANAESFKRIPGFLLLDEDLRVLYDSTGHTPIHNVYTDLLPAAGRLLDTRGD